MGLAGRKVKQRIGNDPRNLSWADGTPRTFVTFRKADVLTFWQMRTSSVLRTCRSWVGLLAQA